MCDTRQGLHVRGCGTFLHLAAAGATLQSVIDEQD